MKQGGRISGIVCLALLSLQGQQGRVSGPVSGLVFDSSARALRPVLGIPGASFMGEPLNLGFDVVSAWVSPRQDSAVVVAADGGLHLFRLDSLTAAERPWNGLAAPERVAFSPSGTAAVLYAAGKAQLITGLPDAPVAAGTIDLGKGLDSRGAAPARGQAPRVVHPSLAVCDDGSLLLVAARGSVRLFHASGGNRSLMDAGPGALAAFAPGGHDGAVVDAGGAGLVLFRDLAGAAGRQTLASADAGMASPAGLAFSADGRTLFLASAAGRSVAAFDVAGGAGSVLKCDCAPEGLTAMGSGLFRLNEPGPAPLWLLDTGTTQPRIVFVPAAVSARVE